MIDVFISYPRSEREAVERVRSLIQQKTTNIFFDLEGIDGGDDFPNVIDRALKTSKCVVCCWSDDYFRSRWCMIEGRYALKHGLIIPVVLGPLNEANLPADFTHINYFDLSQRTDDPTQNDTPRFLASLDRKLHRLQTIISKGQDTVSVDEAQLPPPTNQVREDVSELGKLQSIEHTSEPIAPLMDDESCRLVWIDGPSQIYAEIKGRRALSKYHFENTPQLDQFVAALLAAADLRLPDHDAVLDFRMQTGERVQVIYRHNPTVELSKYLITIEKIYSHRIGFRQLLQFGSVSRLQLEHLNLAVLGRKNIIVAGGAGSAPITYVRALGELGLPDEQKLAIHHFGGGNFDLENCRRIEATPNGQPGVSVSDLLEAVPLMYSERVLLDECRGPELWDLLQHANADRFAFITSVRATSPEECLTRLELMAAEAVPNLSSSAIRRHIAMAADVILHVERRNDGRRQIAGIFEVQGMDKNGEIKLGPFNEKSVRDIRTIWGDPKLDILDER